MNLHFKIDIDLGSDALQPENGGRYELVRILRSIADQMEKDHTFSEKIRDFNGNTVGSTRIVETRQFIPGKGEFA